MWGPTQKSPRGAPKIEEKKEAQPGKKVKRTLEKKKRRRN